MQVETLKTPVSLYVERNEVYRAKMCCPSKTRGRLESLLPSLDE